MLLSLQRLSKKYPVHRDLFGVPSNHIEAVADVSLQIDEGKILGIVGESGSGKSTLGRCAVGLERPSSGTIFWEDVNIGSLDASALSRQRRFFQLVFQNPSASLNPRRKIEDILLEPMAVHDLLPRAQRMDWVHDTIRKCGLLASDLQKYPHEFSGGQKQRIVLARALAFRPKLLVLDEPLASLDISIQASILNLLKRLNREVQIGYLFISHDLQTVGYLSEKIAVMYSGQIVEMGPTQQVLREPKHPYTKVLVDASSMRNWRTGNGAVPENKVSTGCRFASRCPLAQDRCFFEVQSLEEIGTGWKSACWKWAEIN